MTAAAVAGSVCPRMPTTLYDVHAHIGLDAGFYLRRWWPYSATVRELLGHMNTHGIKHAVCFPFTLPSAFDPYAFADRQAVELLPGRFPFDRENELLRVEIGRFDPLKRLLQFGMFDPAREVAKQVKSLETLIGTMAGLKTQTTVLQSPILTLLDEGRDLMELAQQYDLPVLFHTAVNPSDRWAQPEDCLAVAERFPRVRFNLAHSLRFDREYLKRAASMANVWVDCSAHLVHCELALNDAPAVAPRSRRVDADYSKPAEVLATIYALLHDRYLWGSDSPYMSWCDDSMSAVYTYRMEAEVLLALPSRLRHGMALYAPEWWLYGDKAVR